MKLLKQQAISFGKYPITFQGKKIGIETWTIHFPKWSGAGLSKSVPGTYRNKSLVNFNGEPLFGELAVLRWLQNDGWDGVWVDTFHSSSKEKLFWKGLPDRTDPSALPLKAKMLYEKIMSNHPKDGGFFDVFAWRGRKFLFVEYKSKGDRLNNNQRLWMGSAIRSGVSPTSLVLVEYLKRSG
ncbi:MAG: VRR-NUC domain-containing protein [Verrucomicrobiia bacterium]